MDNPGSTSAVLRLRADRDIATRSVPGILAYVLLWGIVAAASDLRNSFPILVWSVGGAYAVLSLFRFSLVRHFDILYRTSPRRWRVLFAVGVALSSGIWGLFCALALEVSGFGVSTLLVLLATAGISSGVAAALAPTTGILISALSLLLLPPIPVSLGSGQAVGIGVGLMFLVYLAFLLLIGRRLHKEYWSALRQSVEMESMAGQVRAILDTVADGIITIDERGIVRTVNPAAERIFGYRADEVVGRNVSMLMPEPYRSAHDGYIDRYLRTGERRVIGGRREAMGMRGDGSMFPIDLAVSEMAQEGRRLFIGLVRDITERRKVDRLKSEFVSTVSHELRTPLTSIRGALGLVGSGATGPLPDKAKELIDIASRNSARLSRLIDDILDIEKIESGRMQFNLKAQPLWLLVEQSIEANRAYGEQYQVSFKLLPGAREAQVVVDGERLMQVMANLLSNAAKFSPPDTTVDIEVRELGRMVRVSVRDHGPGMPEDFIPRIFQKFSQADSSDTRAKGGTGLGLSIVKAIVEQFGGDVGFATGPGGTTFHFDLPLAGTQ